MVVQTSHSPLPLVALALSAFLAPSAQAGEVEVGPYVLSWRTMADHPTNYVQVENEDDGTYDVVVLGCAPTADLDGATCTFLVGDETGFRYVSAAVGCVEGGECPYVVLDVNGISRRLSLTPYAGAGCAGVVPYGLPPGPSPAPLACLGTTATNGCTTHTLALYDASTAALVAHAGAAPCLDPAGACVTTSFGTGYRCGRAELVQEAGETCVVVHRDDNGVPSTLDACVPP